MPPPPPPPAAAAAAGLGSTTQSTYSTIGGNIWDSKPYQYNMPWTDRGGHETMDNRALIISSVLYSYIQTLLCCSDAGSRILDGKIATVPGPLMDDFLQNTADRAFNDLSLQVPKFLLV